MIRAAGQPYAPRNSLLDVPIVGMVAQVTVFIALAGFAAQALPQWNWYAFSNAFTLGELLDAAVGFFLAGIVITKVGR